MAVSASFGHGSQRLEQVHLVGSLQNVTMKSPVAFVKAL